MNKKISVKILNRLLPLVAIGTVADCQSILEPTNRAIVKAGLQVLNGQKHRIKGLDLLVEKTGFLEKMKGGYKLTSSDLGFYFSPILNSSGRLSHAKLSIESLIENDAVKVEKLLQTNFERKEYVKAIIDEVNLQADEESGKNLIWLVGNWNKGVIGLVASRLVSQHEKAVVVVSVSEKEEEANEFESAQDNSELDSNLVVTGSLRSPENFHLVEAMEGVSSELFLKFGGHPQASGFSALKENLDQIKKEFEAQIDLQSQKLTGDQTSFVPKNYPYKLPFELEKYTFRKEILWLSESDINLTFLEEIISLDPFGQDFPSPTLAFKISDYKFRKIGAKLNHLKISLKNGISLTLFNCSSVLLDRLDEKAVPMWVFAGVSQNSWNGETKLELVGRESPFIDE